MPARHGPRTPHDGPCERPSWAASTAYSLGCRCPRCLEWHRDYSAKRRGPDHVRRDQRPAYPGAVEAGCAHPTIGVWRSYQAGCRCVRCVNGCRRYWRQRYERIASRRPKVRSDFAKRLAYSLKERGMDAAALARFLQHYERLSRHALASLAARADRRFVLDARRRPRDLSRR